MNLILDDCRGQSEWLVAEREFGPLPWAATTTGVMTVGRTPYLMDEAINL